MRHHILGREASPPALSISSSPPCTSLCLRCAYRSALLTHVSMQLRIHRTDLRTLLREILDHETTARRMKELPEEAALPQQVRRDLGQLGTVDEDAADIEKRALFSADELDVKSEQEMQRRLEAGISDSIEDLNGGVNGGSAPAFDQTLVGKRLEVLWPYTNRETGKHVLIWATGRVARVADGLTDRRSPRAQAVLPAGMVLWEWDADPEFDEPAGDKWLGLLPQKWNKQQLYSWRYDPREFRADAAPQRDQRRQHVDRMDEPVFINRKSPEGISCIDV